MVHITAQMRVLVAIEAVDGRKGIDSLVRVCQGQLCEDPMTGCVFVFRSRRGTSIRLLSYDGQGYWLAQKRLSKGRFPEACRGVQAHCSLRIAGGGAISLGIRIRLCAAQLKTNRQSTFAKPSSLTWRSGPVCMSHPKPFSTSHRQLRLMA
jgi:hypothetical protein